MPWSQYMIVDFPLFHLAFFLILPLFLSFGEFFFVFPLFETLSVYSASEVDLFWPLGFMVSTSVVEYLWDSVVQSPWPPYLTDLGVWFILALCMSLVFGSCWDFLWWFFPTSWLSEGQSVPHSCFLLCRCGQVILELVFLYVQCFEAFLLLLFSCLFLVSSSLFSCISR